MDNSKKDSALVRFPPPLVFLIAIFLGYVIERYLWSLPLDLGPVGQIALALLCIFAGLLLLLISFLHFRRTGQQPEPWTPTPEIISEGVYRYTRNPMYLGMSLIQLGAGLYLMNIWVILLLPCSMLAVIRIAIVPEEKYLETKFGNTYLQYKHKVRRWL